MTDATKDHRRERLEAASPVAVGDVVGGKYRITELLAVGGMGLVALAEHEVLGQAVAIKFLLPSQHGDDAVRRFLREARAAARLQSEHVVRVYDCGKGPDGIPYMVMERLEGIELSKEMKRRGSFPVDEAVDIVLQALEGVAEAHALKIVHRDLKPSNLFLAGRGSTRRVKVLDFGISKVQPGQDAVEDDDLTLTSIVLGSPRYISPEQAANSRDVDARADVWSLGVITYQLLSGETPFGGDTFGEILTNILLHPPPPLPDLRPDAPPELVAVLDRCLQRDRDERFADVGELALALAPFGGPRAGERAARVCEVLGREVAPTPQVRDPETDGGDRHEGTLPLPSPDEVPTRVADVPPTEDDSPTQGTWAQSEATPASSRAGRVLAALSLVALGAGAVWFFLSHGATTTGTASAPSPPQATAAPPASELPAVTSAPTVTATTSATTAPSSSADAASPAPLPTGKATPPPPRVAAPPPPVRPPPPRPPTAPPAGVLDRSD